MKPLRLQITGLNSFRQSITIDFERLMTDGLFGIFGPTGSGKSSILDAITLALYGGVRRAPGGKTGIINMMESKCAVSLVFQTGDGNGGRRCYAVERTFRRSRTGGVETHNVRLIDGDKETGKTIADKQSEVDRLITTDILGIDLEDFFRAVVLPQGAFADFLCLAPKARAAALQRLFGLHDLGQKLNIRLKARSGELKISRATLDARLSELNRYNDEQLSECEADNRSAEARRMAARIAFDEARKHFEAAKTLYDLLGEYNALAADGKNQSDREVYLAGLHSRLALDERSRTVEPSIRTLDSCRTRHAEAKSEYDNSVGRKARADERLVAARERYMQADRAYESSYSSLSDEITRLEQIRTEKQEIIIRLETLHSFENDLGNLAAEYDNRSRDQESLSKETEEIERKIADIDGRLRTVVVSSDHRELLETLDRKARELGRREDELVERETERVRMASEVAQLDATCDESRHAEQNAAEKVEQLQGELAVLRQQRQKLEVGREELRTRQLLLQGFIDRLSTQEEQRARVEKELRDVCAASDNVARQRVEVERRLADARRDESTAQLARDNISARREAERHHQALALLAAELHDGAPCALCGSTSHPSPYGDTSIQQDIARLDAELQQAEGQFLIESEKVREIDRELAGVIAQVESRDYDLARANDAMKKMREEVASTIAELERDRRPGSLNELRMACNAADAQLLELGEELLRIDERSVLVERQLDHARTSHQEARAEYAARDATRQARTEEAARHAAIIDELNTLLAEGRRDFASYSDGRLPDDIVKEMEEMRRRTREADDLSRELIVLRDQQTECMAKFRSAESEAKIAREKKQEIEVEYRNLKKQIDGTVESISGRLKEMMPEAERGKRVEVLIEDRRIRSEQLKREHDEAKQEYDEASNHDKVMAARHDDHWKQLCAAEKDRDDADRVCSALLRENDFASRDEAVAGLLATDERRQMKEEAAAVDEQMRQYTLDLKRLEAKIDGRSISDEEVDQLRRAYQEATEEHEGAIGMAKATEERLEECRTRNAEWKQLLHDNESLLKEVSTVDHLTRYLVGDAFVNFIANERLAGVCARASRQLRELTGGRLELDSDPEDGFFIRDNGNGGHKRAPSSLSGGEMFLVSLSLALALSDTIQLGSAPLEFFFLDEGFGTLDAELLESVMTSLELLRSQHRAIGVITHVGALRERIARRLVVTPANELQGSTISYEVA